MQEIRIKNFGPIEDVWLPVKDFMVFIGPQASGKSTVSKCIYFFKSLRDDLIKYILEEVEKDDPNKFEAPIWAFVKNVRAKFISFWGPTHHMSDISIYGQYKKEVSLTIELVKDSNNNQYVDPKFSPKFHVDFEVIIREAQNFVDMKNKRDRTFLSSSDLMEIDNERRLFLKRIESLAKKLFNNDKDLVFFPAGRSLLATLSDRLPSKDDRQLDYLTLEFSNRIGYVRQLFDKSLAGMVFDKRNLTHDKIDDKAVGIAQDIIEKVLKGRYRYDRRDGDRLYYDSNRYTKLNYASSGQQESIWIMNLIYLLILENKEVFVVIEEPEAHLYPEAQKQMVDLISLLANCGNNQTIITTHSPYILAALNNLIYAKTIGEKEPEAVAKKIEPKLWIDKDRLGTYFIDNGQLHDIMDEELQLIKTEAIDSASTIINDEYDFLDDLE